MAKKKFMNILTTLLKSFGIYEKKNSWVYKQLYQIINRRLQLRTDNIILFYKIPSENFISSETTIERSAL